MSSVWSSERDVFEHEKKSISYEVLASDKAFAVSLHQGFSTAALLAFELDNSLFGGLSCALQDVSSLTSICQILKTLVSLCCDNQISLVRIAACVTGSSLPEVMAGFYRVLLRWSVIRLFLCTCSSYSNGCRKNKKFAKKMWARA